MQTMYHLISLFVSRQTLVFEALRELRPQILISTGAMVKDQIETVHKSRFDTPPTGYWGANQDWKYFLHGLGCKLVHITTQEPIEWDAPDLKSFDRYWFINWLKWYVNYSEEKDSISFLKSMNSNTIDIFALEMLSKLEADKMLFRRSPQHSNEYTLKE